MITNMRMSGTKIKAITNEVLVAMDWILNNMELAIDAFDGNVRQENEMYEKLDDLLKKIAKVKSFYGKKIVPDAVLEMASEFMESNYWGIKGY